VILVAFAIQFGSVGVGMGAAVAGAPNCLRLCEGGLIPLLWGEARRTHQDVAAIAPWGGSRSASNDDGPAMLERTRVAPVSFELSEAELRIPPPGAGSQAVRRSEA
jgi:hypothetical protein